MMRIGAAAHEEIRFDVGFETKLLTLWISCPDRLGMPPEVRATLELLV
jgi:hypothetical protein